MIYLYTDYEEISDSDLDILYEKLPDFRKERADAFKFNKGRATCIISYLVFLHGYREATGNTDLPDFSYQDNKKPFIDGIEGFHFNISHCSGTIACICHNEACGLDVETVRKVNPKVITKICSRSEAAKVNAADDPMEKFCKYWTIKEAITKVDGSGIFKDVRDINPSVCFTKTLQINGNTFLSYAMQKNKIAHPIVFLTLEDLMKL